MGNFSYENQGASTWLVYTLSDEEVIDSMSLGMITNNAIPGFAGTVFMQMNAVRYIKYNVSSRIPVSQFFSGPVNKRRLLGVFDGIVSGMLAAEEYMINADTIWMDLNYIYADVSTCDAVIICLPIVGAGQRKQDLSLFFKEIMFRTQFDQTENCDHVTKIINYLNSTPVFSLADFKTLIRVLREEIPAGVPVSFPGPGASGGAYPGGASDISGGMYSGGGSGVSGGTYSGSGSGISGGMYPEGGSGVSGGTYSGSGSGVSGGMYPGGGSGVSGGTYSGSGSGISGGMYPGGGSGVSGGMYPGNGSGASDGSCSSTVPGAIPPIPGGPTGAGAKVQTPSVQHPGLEAETGNKEKGMSLFYLLRHYDKENAGIYKAQKEEKKQQKASREPKKKEKKEKPAKDRNKKDKKGTGFAIPGQMAPPIPPTVQGSTIPPIPPVSGRTVPGTGTASLQAAGQHAVLPGAGTFSKEASVSPAFPTPPGTVPVSVPPKAALASQDIGISSGSGPALGMPVVSVAPVLQQAGGTGAFGADFGNTVFLGSDDEDDGGATMIMGAGMDAAGPQVHPHLIRRRNNERIPISQNVFRLGRNQDFNDYVILGNDFVGNTHCHILIRGEEYFIMDDNSKNHTFVNGVMVMPGTEVKLMHGQTVTLADEEFEFRLF